jgi:hypothetical protein
MDAHILEKWLPELPGLLNKVLDAGIKLEASKGFIEPQASSRLRSIFEGGSNPVKKWAGSYFEFNLPNDPVIWGVRKLDMKSYFNDFREETGLLKYALSDFYAALESIDGVKRDGKVDIKWPSSKTGWKSVRCWQGLRKIGTSGVIDGAISENTPF